MRFFNRPRRLYGGRQLHARTMRAWRSAADLVWMRWTMLCEATPEFRPAAFAAYLSALDAEASAAAKLAEIDIGHAR